MSKGRVDILIDLSLNYHVRVTRNVGLSILAYPVRCKPSFELLVGVGRSRYRVLPIPRDLLVAALWSRIKCYQTLIFLLAEMNSKRMTAGGRFFLLSPWRLAFKTYV